MTNERIARKLNMWTLNETTNNLMKALSLD
jgi:hypothetical protein